MVRLPFILDSALVGVPLIYDARRFRDRPRACALRAAFAVSVSCVLVVMACRYSGLLGSDSASEDAFIAVFGAVVSSVSIYLLAYRMLTRPKVKIDKSRE